MMTKRTAPKKRFAICLTDSEPDLELRKVYQVLRDVRAAKDDYILVVDESGEDYLYPASYFAFVEMSQFAEQALLGKHKSFYELTQHLAGSVEGPSDLGRNKKRM